MTIVALTGEDRKALMEALDSRTPGVRQARVAHALLLMAEGLPAPVVAEYLFLPEAVVTQYWQAFMLGRNDARAAGPRPPETETQGEDITPLAGLGTPPLRSFPGRRRWVQDLRGSHPG